MTSHMTKIVKVNIKSQLGVSILALAMILSLVAIVAMGGIKVLPSYMDNNVIKGSIETLIDNEDVSEMRIAQIRGTVMRNLTVNGIRGFDSDNIQLVREEGKEYINVSYESRVPLFYNIDAIVYFDYRFDK